MISLLLIKKEFTLIDKPLENHHFYQCIKTLNLSNLAGSNHRIHFGDFEILDGATENITI